MFKTVSRLLLQKLWITDPMVVTSLTMTIAHFCGCSPLLEQPTGSSMPKAEPLKSVLCGIGAKKTVIWHGAYSGQTPKPLQIWSPRDLYALVKPRPNNLVANLVINGTKRMNDGSEVKTYTGAKNMKASQTYCAAFGEAVASLARTWVNWCQWLRPRSILCRHVAWDSALPQISIQNAKWHGSATFHNSLV